MLKPLISSPNGVMVAFLVLVNALSALMTTLLWFPLSHQLPETLGRSLGGLAPMIITVLLSVPLSTIFSKWVTKPLADMIKATEAIAQGDYSIQVKEAGVGEVRRLLQSFNQMTAELGGVEMMRADFINTFSHEFRTPIVSIRGFAKRLRRGGLSEEKQSEYLDYIVSQSQRLTDLSTNILLLSKYEHQHFLGEQREYDLGEQLRRAILLLEGQWETKDIQFSLEVPETFRYTGNEEMLDLVWQNLLGNAVKFTPHGGRICVCLKREGDRVLVTVSDNGVGMDADTKSHIFEKFYQGDTAHSVGGSGLGLPLVKRIVELHQGNISVESAVGEGTTFTVILIT